MIKNNNISDKEAKDYSISSYQEDEKNLTNKENQEKLTEEFLSAKNYAKSYRSNFERIWKQIDAYIWNDTAKISNKNLKEALNNCSVNHLFTIFNFRYSNTITNNVSEGITVTPGFVSKKILDLSASPESLDDKNKQNFEITNYLLKVKQFRDILKFYWNDVSFDEINKFVFWDYILYGTGVIELYWNETNKNKNNDGNLEGYYVPLFSFFLEPEVINWQDSRYVIVAQEINLLNLQRVHNLSNEKMKEITEKIGETNNNINNVGENNNYSQFNKTVPYYRYYKKYLDDKNNIKISLNYFVGSNASYLVETIPDIGIDQFPFEILFSYKKPTESYGQSLFKFLLPAHKMMMQQDAVIKARAIQAANPIVLVNDESGINLKILGKDGGMTPGQTYHIKGDPKKVLDIVKLNDIPEDALAYIQILKGYMDIMANTTETTTGNKAITGAATGAAQQNYMSANLPFKIQESEIQTYYQRTLNLVVKLLQAKQTEIRQFILPNKTSSNVQFQPMSYSVDGDFTELAKNCSISIKATSLVDMEKERNLILELYKWSIQFPELRGAISGIDVIRAFHLPNEDEMIAQLQLQTDTDYEQIATQIVQYIHENVEMGLNAEQQKAQLQAYVQSGEINQADAEKALENIPQPLSIEDEISLVTSLVRNNPARILENEKGVTNSAVETLENVGG